MIIKVQIDRFGSRAVNRTSTCPRVSGHRAGRARRRRWCDMGTSRELAHVDPYAPRRRYSAAVTAAVAARAQRTTISAATRESTISMAPLSRKAPE